ncbi:MAG: hypothetical protein J0L75_04310 [Spirochaetes bacterium]|nr:hypothetical protein [Spirochaetota bacterium]
MPPSPASPFRLKELFIVSLPIGNPGDLPPRAVEALRACDAVVAETAVGAKRALDHCGVAFSEKVVHELNIHNRDRDSRQLADQLLEEHARVALISEAGSPILADPGSRLAGHLAECGVALRYVAGASSIIAALSVAGLPCEEFYFAGFLPRDEMKAVARLKDIARFRATTVILEAPHRLPGFLEILHKGLPPATRVALAFNLTCDDEEVWRGSAGEARRALADEKRKRPFVCVAEAPRV